jgi:glycosyltransferase involved in cell wall biosynthesis
MRNNNVSFIIPTYNEERNLEKCIKSLEKEIRGLKNPVRTFICLNGCIDKTPEIAEKCVEKYRNLNIKILKSKRGKINAQEIAIKNIKSLGYIIFLDGDIKVRKNCIKKLIKELDKHKKLIAVGAFSVAENYNGKNPWKKFLDQILNIRSRHPLCEISKFDVKEYHPYALSDPQYKNTSSSHELKSKIYFHGRMFALRSKKFWSKPDPKKDIVGDDSFMPDNIIYKYGVGRIRMRYDAIVYYKPFISLRKHFKVYKRIFYDLKNLEDNYLKFKKIRKLSKLRLDKEYIKKQNLRTKINFKLHELTRKIEKFLFKISINKDPKKIWVYKKK